MAFTSITDNDLAGKGTVGMADTPNLTAPEMQAKFDELPNIVINKFKTHITEESANTAASNIGAVDPTTGGEATNIQGVLDNLQNKKQEKETGKGLSANDFTDTYKEELDTAFENNHTHSNKSVLDLITSVVKTAYDRLVTLFTNITTITTTVNGSDTALPTAGAISRYVQQMGGGDMVKSIYDTDNDGIVDHAEVADALQNPIAATAVTYNHTASGLPAEDVQAAIDEVHNEAKNSVQTSAIENDLLGTDATKILAATQGKVLDGKITTINSNLKWKTLNPVIGNGNITLPSSFSEIHICCGQNIFNVNFTFHMIPSDFSEISTIRNGFYIDSGSYGTCVFNVNSSTSISLNTYSIRGTDYASTAITSISYR